MSFRRILCLVAVSSAVTVGLAPSSQADSPPEAGAQIAGATVDHVAAYVNAVVGQEIAAYVETTRQAEAEAAAREAQERAAAIGRFVSASARRVPAPAPSYSTGGGFPSEAFFHKLAVCEEGGQNHPYFGYFGKIDGAWAGLSWDEQVARARVLWAQNASHISTTWTSVPSCTGPPF